MTPYRILRARPLWITNGVITGALALLFTVFYVGANIDPAGHLKNLPVALVNADTGELGTRVAQGIAAAPGDKVEWKTMTEREARTQLGKGKLYGALVVPADFSVSVTALSNGTATHRPTLTILTNQSAGSLGSSFARQATATAATAASVQLGRQLTLSDKVLAADPIAVHIEDGHPLGDHSGVGLTAFYYSLVPGPF